MQNNVYSTVYELVVFCTCRLRSKNKNKTKHFLLFELPCAWVSNCPYSCSIQFNPQKRTTKTYCQWLWGSYYWDPFGFETLLLQNPVASNIIFLGIIISPYISQVYPDYIPSILVLRGPGNRWWQPADKSRVSVSHFPPLSNPWHLAVEIERDGSSYLWNTIFGAWTSIKTCCKYME